jgi:hypothetical protein
MCVVCGCGKTGERDALIAWAISEQRAVHVHRPGQARVAALAQE